MKVGDKQGHTRKEDNSKRIGKRKHNQKKRQPRSGVLISVSSVGTDSPFGGLLSRVSYSIRLRGWEVGREGGVGTDPKNLV